MYWMISYSWKTRSGRIHAMELWQGSIPDWLIRSIEQPEDWVLLNAQSLSRDEFLQVKEEWL